MKVKIGTEFADSAFKFFNCELDQQSPPRVQPIIIIVPGPCGTGANQDYLLQGSGIGVVTGIVVEVDGTGDVVKGFSVTKYLETNDSSNSNAMNDYSRFKFFY